jgi:hypothetical protein
MIGEQLGKKAEDKEEVIVNAVNQALDAFYPLMVRYLAENIDDLRATGIDVEDLIATIRTMEANPVTLTQNPVQLQYTRPVYEPVPQSRLQTLSPVVNPMFRGRFEDGAAAAPPAPMAPRGAVPPPPPFPPPAPIVPFVPPPPLPFVQRRLLLGEEALADIAAQLDEPPVPAVPRPADAAPRRPRPALPRELRRVLFPEDEEEEEEEEEEEDEDYEGDDEGRPFIGGCRTEQLLHGAGLGHLVRSPKRKHLGKGI